MVGDGIDVSILSSTITTSGQDGNYNSIIKMYSSTLGSEGNHYFKDLTFDGNSETVPIGAYIRKRDSVVFDNCKFINFYKSGIDISGLEQYYTEPSIYITGFKVHDCIFYNSSGYWGTPTATAYGALDMGTTKGTEIYNNSFIQPAYANRRRGILIKGTKCEHVELRIYNNEIYKYCRDESLGVPDLPFAIELWDTRGACEIYNNKVIGAIDVVNVWSKGNTAGNYSYGAKIYDNEIGTDTCQQVNYPGIMLESNCYDIEVFRNFCNHTGTAISFASQYGWNDTVPHTWQPFTKNNIKIHYNIFWELGTSTPDDPNDDYQRALNFGSADTTHTYDSIMFYNNIVTNNETYDTEDYAILLPINGTSTNFFFKNNIFLNMKYDILRGEGGRTYLIGMDNLQFTNNIIFNSGNNSYVWFTNYQNYLTNFTWSDNIIADPQWINGGTNFNLQSTSPAINTGVDVGLTEDYIRQSLSSTLPPEIGILEYIPPIPQPVISGGFAKDKNGRLMIDKNGNFTKIE